MAGRTAAPGRVWAAGPAVWALHLLIPLAALLLLVRRPDTDVMWEHHAAHFWLVLGTAIVNVGLALVVGETARRREDGRLFLVSLGFAVSAGFLGLHALATPGVILPATNAGFVVATPVGLLLASLFAVASSIELSEAGARRLRRAQRPLVLAVGLLLGAWALISLTGSAPLDRPVAPDEAQGPLLAAALAGSVLYGVAAWRFFGVHRRRPSVMLVSLITAFVLLAEAMFAVTYGRNWQASWWEWHVLMTTAFAFVAYSAYVQYRREGSPAGLFQGVALDRTVARIRQDYAEALEELVAAVQQRAEADPPAQPLARSAAAVARRFDLTERQLDVLERSADALGRERRQSTRLGALVAVGQEASVIQAEEALADRAMAMADTAFRPLRLRLGLLHDGVLVHQDGPAAGSDPAAAGGDRDGGGNGDGDGDVIIGLRQAALRTGEPAASPEGRSFVVPLDVKGHKVGVLEASDPHRPIAEADRQVLRSFASQLSMALENTRLYRSLEGLFRTYMSPDVATSLLADPEQARLGGHIVEVTVLMADLRGFTPFSERTPPDQVVAMLNAYYGAVVPVILAEGGTVTQFVGDAVMAIFNAPARQPDHVRRAVRATLGLQRAVDAIRVDRADWPPFRVGVNTGPALVGNIGSAEMRNFTAVGDTTNLAARLESTAEPGQVVIGPLTRAALGDSVDVDDLGPILVKGKQEPVEAFVLRDLR